MTTFRKENIKKKNQKSKQNNYQIPFTIKQSQWIFAPMVISRHSVKRMYVFYFLKKKNDFLMAVNGNIVSRLIWFLHINLKTIQFVRTKKRNFCKYISISRVERKVIVRVKFRNWLEVLVEHFFFSRVENKSFMKYFALSL